MSNVDPEEVEALLGPGEAKNERVVDARDFRRPRRLSTEQREGLSELVGGVLEDLEARLGKLLDGKVTVELASIGEVNATDLFGGEDGPTCVASFVVGGTPGWAIWESAMAVNAVEELLGAGSETTEARPLSALEACVLLDILVPLVYPVAAALGATCEGFEVVQVRQTLEIAAARAAEADPHRLEVELAVGLGEESSSLRLYLPGIHFGDDSAETEVTAVLPTPANQVPVVLHARLAGSDVPLSQLLALAVGDVIPLEDRADDPVPVFVGETRYGTARLGTHEGRLALRMEQIGKSER